MGFPGLDHFGSTPIISSMKVLCILALAVAVSAEADHHLLYKSLLPVTGYYQQPLVYKQPAPVVYKQQVPLVYHQQPLVYKQAVPAVVPKYQAVSPGVSHTVLKREAEAEPNHHLVYNVPATTYAHQPLVYKQPAVVYKQPAVVYKQPAVVYKQPIAYQQPIVYKQPVAPVMTPVVYKAQPVNYMAGSFADDSKKPFDYAAKGKYIANSAGTIHIAKREAEAEAEAEPTHTVGYNTYQTGPLSYVKQPIVAYNKPIVAYNNYGYSGLYSPYATTYAHSYGKREAEAEAEPWTVYGGAFNYPLTTYGVRTPYTTYGGYGVRTPYTYSSMNYPSYYY